MDKSLANRAAFSPAAFFDEQFGVTARDLDQVLGRAMARQADYADLFFEYRTHEQVRLEEGLVKHASVSTANGVGARVLAEDKTGYAFTDDVTIQNLDSAVRTANVIAHDRGTDSPARIPVPAAPRHDLYPVPRSFSEVPLERKIGLLEDLDRFARKADPRVKGVFASLSLENKVILIASSQGWVLGDLQPWAVATPRAPWTWSLGPGWPGILLHEAIGHGLEADFNRRKTSAFSGRIGERVATELCTVVDDGTIPRRRGSLNVDDEGTPTQRTVLIEDGILRGYMHDRLNASLLGMELTATAAARATPM
ncbi:Metalloprotease TldD homolog [Geodia barretti]|uniref:Metalloprotease TldD homolog n=1 Tax=Geodia barretti TaxID=519541 RepID=A0AA35WWQ3_GEOBA|nr:Metalloprotease TldD homolog [Geodia barretti]